MRRKRKHVMLPEDEINVVPLMDVLTTMIFFLVFMATMSNYTSVVAKTQNYSSSTQEKKPVFELALAIHSHEKIELYLAKTDGLQIENPSALSAHLAKFFKKEEGVGFRRTFKVNKGENISKVLADLNPHLLAIKKAFPNESKMTFIISNSVNYQDLMTLIEGVHETGSKESPIPLFTEVSLQELATEAKP